MNEWKEASEAIERLAEMCHEYEHATDYHHDICDSALPAVRATTAAEVRARTFDAGQAAAARGDSMPAHTWDTTSLMRVARNAALGQPNIDGLRRATLITTALARLAERGFPADAFIRTCLAETLANRVSATVCAVWAGIANGEFSRSDVSELEDWLQMLDVMPGIQDLQEPELSDVLAVTHRDRFEAFVEHWIATTSIAHILGWRCKDQMTVSPQEEDLYIGGDRSATMWVFERFTETYLDRWSDQSLHWELAFIACPNRVGAALQLDLPILAERTVLANDIANEFARRVTHVNTLDRSSTLPAESVLALLEAGDISLACSLALRIAKSRPEDRTLRQLRWFSALTTRPAEAREAFLKMTRESADPVLLANIASCYLMEHDLKAAHRTIEPLRANEAWLRTGPAWLWWPSSIANAPRVQFTSLRGWLANLDQLKCCNDVISP